MNDILTKPYTFEHKGKTYTISHITGDVQAEFEKWVKQNAIKTLVLSKPYLPPDEYEADKKEFYSKLHTGGFDFVSDICVKALDTPAGGLKMMSLLFGCSKDEMMELVKDRGEEIKLLFETIKVESQPKN